MDKTKIQFDVIAIREIRNMKRESLINKFEKLVFGCWHFFTFEVVNPKKLKQMLLQHVCVVILIRAYVT